jgi:hypothetical protein
MRLDSTEIGTLVNRFISQQNEITVKNRGQVKGFDVYENAIRVVREFDGSGNTGGGVRGNIESFSKASKRRLKFKASNANPHLISQFCMTYHNSFPPGDVVKKQLNKFLTYLRRYSPGVKYLWILEFQSRGFPHFHLFLDLPYDTPGLRQWMAKTWNHVTQEDELHLTFHQDQRNFIQWDMGSGQYLTKYLDKEHQKAVPEGYESVGRFWGNSRGLVPPPACITEDELSPIEIECIDPHTGEVKRIPITKYITRQLGRFHQKQLNAFKKKSRLRGTPTSYMLLSGAPLFWQVIEWALNNKPIPF